MSTEVLSVASLLWDGVGCLCEPPVIIRKAFSSPLSTACLHRPERGEMRMLEMAVDYNLGYCFRNGAPKEAESGKRSLTLHQYPRGRVVSLSLWSASL